MTQLFASLLFLLVNVLMVARTNAKPAKDAFEGDMVLTSIQDKAIQEAIKTGNFIDPTESETFAATTSVFPKWTNGIVPYTLSSSLSSRALYAIRQGIAEWEKSTCIRFKKRTTERNYLEFFKSSGCWGHVGMARGKSQISVGNGCEYRHVMTHEIGHALGFFHEQSRTDRDNYVRIQWSNIPSALHSAFEKYGKDKLNSLGQPYDYGSIMHYPWNAFSNNGRNTLVPKRKVYQQPYTVLSKSDAIQANLMYKCGGTTSKPVTKGTAPPEPPTENPSTVNPVTKCEEVIVEETVVVPVGGSCRSDRNRLCRYWAGRGECSRNPSYMRENCCKSCGISGSCKDNVYTCSSWARRGECNRNPGYMHVNCAKSCKKCTTTTTTKVIRKKVRKCKVVQVTTTAKPVVPPIPTDEPETGMPPIPTTANKTGTPPIPTTTPSTNNTAPPVTTPPLPPSCNFTRKAGLEDGSLDNGSLSASTSYNKVLAADSGRLNGILAWCSETADDKQYLSIDLGKVTLIKGVITQGLDVPIPQYVKKFYISYSEDNKLWNNVAGESLWAVKEFSGNKDGKGQAKSSIEPPIVARYVKVHPIEWENHVCLRAELIIC